MANDSNSAQTARKPVLNRLIEWFLDWQQAPRQPLASQIAPRALWYQRIGALAGRIVAAAVFVMVYAYCISRYGLLFGLGLGWLSAGILAAATYLIVRYLWAPVALVAGFALAWMAVQPPPKPGDIGFNLLAEADSLFAPNFQAASAPTPDQAGVAYRYDPTTGSLAPAGNDPYSSTDPSQSHPNLVWDPKTGEYAPAQSGRPETGKAAK